MKKKVLNLFQFKNLELGNVHRFLPAEVLIYIECNVKDANLIFYFLYLSQAHRGWISVQPSQAPPLQQASQSQFCLQGPRNNVRLG